MFRFGLFARLHEENKEGQEGQEGKGTPPPFDIDQLVAKLTQSVTQSVTADVNKAFNAMDKKINALKAAVPPAEPPKPAAGEPPKPGEGEPKGERPPQINNSPEYNALAQQLRDLQANSTAQITELQQKTAAAEAKAEKKDRESQITSTLAGYKFRSETARADAMRYFADVAERDDNGDLLANNLPLKKFIEQEMSPAGSRSYMIAPADTNGSGAGKGSPHGAGKPVNIEDIKPGMSREELAKARAQVAALAGSGL